jgi:putative FmdB family regulatory protein
MPIYEYRCPNGHTFELFQRMTDPQPDACEVCGAGPVERVLYPVAVHYKGSGFYSTDYGRGNRKQAAKDGSDSSSSSSSGDSSSSGESTSSEKKAAAAD